MTVIGRILEPFPFKYSNQIRFRHSQKCFQRTSDGKELVRCDVKIDSFRIPFAFSRRSGPIGRIRVDSCRRAATIVCTIVFEVRHGGCRWFFFSSPFWLVFNSVFCSFATSNVVSATSRTARVSPVIRRIRSSRWIFRVSFKRNSWFSSRWWRAKTFSPRAHRRWCRPGRRTFPAKWFSSPAKVRRRTIRASIWSVCRPWPTLILRRRNPFWWWNTFTITIWTNSNGSCASTTTFTSERTISSVCFARLTIVSRTIFSSNSCVFSHSRQRLLHRTTGHGNEGRVRQIGLGRERKLLHGRTGHHSFPRNFGSFHSAHQKVFEEFLHASRRCGTRSLCSQVRQHVVHVVLRNAAHSLQSSEQNRRLPGEKFSHHGYFTSRQSALDQRYSRLHSCAQLRPATTNHRDGTTNDVAATSNDVVREDFTIEQIDQNSTKQSVEIDSKNDESETKNQVERNVAFVNADRRTHRRTDDGRAQPHVSAGSQRKPSPTDHGWVFPPSRNASTSNDESI